MSGTTTKSFYYERKKYTVYAILDDLSSCVYVWQTASSDLKDVYEKHYFGKIAGTKAMFEAGKMVDLPPKMYRLEEVFGTGDAVYRNCLAWSKYFLDCGYDNQNRRFPASYFDVLIPETQEIYDRIKGLPFNEVTLDEICANYGQRRKKADSDPDRPRQISIVLSPEEYARVKQGAEKAGITPTAYTKKMVLDGEVRLIDYRYIIEYKNSLRDIERLIKNALVAGYEAGRFSPEELQTLQDLCNQAGELHHEAMKGFNRGRYKLRKQKNKS